MDSSDPYESPRSPDAAQTISDDSHRHSRRVSEIFSAVGGVILFSSVFFLFGYGAWGAAIRPINTIATSFSAASWPNLVACWPNLFGLIQVIVASGSLFPKLFRVRPFAWILQVVFLGGMGIIIVSQICLP
jgi:hypothetical protein